MSRKSGLGKYVKFLLYLLVVVMLNAAGITLFFRFDLTKNGLYSISPASKQVVSAISEPLTINVFFTEHLPAPYNSVERYLRDLLEEYAVYANTNFNYRFFNVSADEGEMSEDAKENRKLANNYGIHPVQIQAVENDEVKFQRAYMGMVLIYGDLIEQIPTITTTEGLEYKLTTLIQKMTQKISALLALSENIEIKLFQSTALESVGPYIGIRNLAAFPDEIKALVQKLNGTHYGKLSFEVINPASEEDIGAVANRYNLLVLSWPELSDGKVPSGKGVIGLVVSHGESSLTIPLLKVIRLPIVGTQYQLTNMEDLEPVIHADIETLIDVNANLGYLAGHGTLSVSRSPRPPAPGHPPEEAAGNFRNLISQTYSLKPVNLAEGDTPEGFNCLVIARPLEAFTDYELYQIDQFLMRGNTLAVIIDAFEENRAPGETSGLGAPPAQFRPLSTGLEKLLVHYGIRVKSSYVMDENCFRQEMPAQLGGGEQPIYFAPLIKNRNINHHLAVLRNIKSLVALRISPLEVDDNRIEEFDLTARRLFSSSEKSWEMKDHINLNPMFIRPPANPDDMERRPLAYVLEGSFPSYFDGKPIPARETTADESSEESSEDQPRKAESEGQQADVDSSKIEPAGQFIARGKPGKIFVLASGDMLRDNVIDAQGQGPNAVFILNMIDYLNGREDTAVMRGKEQRFSPLEDTSGAMKTFVKTFNIAGLPALVVLFGMLVWFRRISRKKHIQAMFRQQGGVE